MGMRMRTAFLLASLGGLLLFLLGVWAFADSYYRIARMTELQQQASAVIGSGRRLGLHSHDLVLHGDVRLRQQWHTLRDELAGALAQRRDAFADFQRETAAIEHYLGVLERQLGGYLDDRERAAGDPAGIGANSLRTMQISLRITELQSAVDELEAAVEHAVDAELGASGQGLVTKFAILFGLYVLAGATAWWFFYLRMQRPLSALAAGIHRIRSGDHRFRPDKVAPDEIGSVVDAFNDLLDARGHAEAALREHQERLEELVAQRTDELRRARDSAEAASRAKSVFLANMSHELRTPLNAILGFTQLMRRDPRILDEERAGLSTIDASARHLLGLIDDVLAIARVEHGGVERESFDLHDLLANLLDVMGPRAAAKRLELRLERAPNLPQQVESDPAKLRRILLNLLANAVKYTQQGCVTLSAGVAEDGETAGAVALVVEVRDTGVGIGEADLEQVFSPFYQTEHGIRLGEGVGLGLTIGREYARLLGGELTAERTAGIGARFRLRVPVRRSARLDAGPGQAIPLPEAAQLADAAELSLGGLSDELRRALRDAAEGLDTEAMQAAIGRVRALDPEIAQRLLTLARGYEFERIRELCGGEPA